MTRSTPAIAIAITLAALAATTAAPHDLTAQVVMGRVVDHADGTPLADVHVRLLEDADAGGDPVAEGFSDDDGRFRLPVPDTGTWHIAADRIGFASTVSALAIEDERGVTIEIRMSVDPIPMGEPIVVTGIPEHTNPDIEAFHDRRRRGERMGIGHYIYGEQLERHMGSPTELLRTISGVVVSGTGSQPSLIRMRRNCIAALYVDGVQINRTVRGESLDTYVSVRDIEGIEVYRGANPPGPYHDDRGCGTVLVWTRRDTRDANPFGWARLVAAIGFALIVLVLR